LVFRSRADGSHHPITGKKGTSPQTLQSLSGQNRHRTRLLTRKERNRLSTLENPLLYSNFVKKMERLNPDIFDADAMIDKSLEPEEMLLALKKRYPELDIGLKSETGAEFREFLDEYGISNAHIQNLVAMQEPPLDESELANLSYVLNNRPQENIMIHKHLRAPVTRDIRRWVAKPNRLDLQGTRI